MALDFLKVQLLSEYSTDFFHPTLVKLIQMSSFQLSREETRNVYMAGIIPVGHWVRFGQNKSHSFM